MLILFLFLPSLSLFIGSFQDAQGHFTLANIAGLFTPSIRSAYWITIRISVFTAVAGGLFGFFVAYAGVLSGLPRWVRDGLMTFSGVASNFAGVPLAFAFIATLGRLGMVTVLLKEVLGINLYDGGFSLYSFLGPEPDLPVFPVSTDGADHHAGARGADAAIGARRPRTWAPPAGSTGATSACRSCCRRCWAP